MDNAIERSPLLLDTNFFKKQRNSTAINGFYRQFILSPLRFLKLFEFLFHLFFLSQKISKRQDKNIVCAPHRKLRFLHSLSHKHRTLKSYFQISFLLGSNFSRASAWEALHVLTQILTKLTPYYIAFFGRINTRSDLKIKVLQKTPMLEGISYYSIRLRFASNFLKFSFFKKTSTQYLFFAAFLIVGFYKPQLIAQNKLNIKKYNTVTIGAQQFQKYLPLLKGKRVGIVTNITGVIGKTSIVDTLIKLKVKVKKIFGPEHGFRSDVEAGEKVQSNVDKKTGLTVISLYGANKKPKPEQLKDLDILVYDIQDIGVRFYTYISTMCYVMEACAESNKEFLVLDRPNPNGFYIDGPVLKEEFKGFLGLHPVPVVYGMTCGEYAKMVNEEGWLKDKVKCKLQVISLQNYDRNASYQLPVKPSPNIPNPEAVLLYPGLGLFEGTPVSVGRGTDFPFQLIGHPNYPDTNFVFIPKASALSKEPKYFNSRCYGLDLRKENYLQNHPRRINLSWLVIMYNQLNKYDFFEKGFNYHAGNKELQEQIKNNLPEAEIRKRWEEDILAFKLIRKKYLLYKDFE